MLYYSLVVTVPVVVAAFGAARRPPKPVRWLVFFGVSLVAFWASAIAFAAAAFLTAVGLTIGLMVWAEVRHRGRRFWPLAVVAVALGYTPGVVIGIVDQREWDRLRARYPLESMAARLPHTPPRPTGPLTRAAVGELDAFEGEVTAAGRDWSNRAVRLERLHAETLTAFVNNPGFGMTRMLRMPTAASLANVRREPPPVTTNSLSGLHLAGVLDYAHPLGFGYVRGRDHAAGFAGHGTTGPPASTPDYAVESVALIGLLVHPTPVVYVTPGGPTMGLPADTPTRLPDAFEAAGLAALVAGGEMHLGAVGPRMVGPIRNAVQCQACHGGDRGDLLGAFSYVLKPAPAAAESAGARD